MFIVIVIAATIGFSLIFFVGILRTTYLQTLKGLGKEAADRNIHYMWPRLLVSLLLGFLAGFFLFIIVPLLAQRWNLTLLLVRWWEYTDSGRFLTYGVFVSFWLVIGTGRLSWPLRKRAAGNLLLNAGRTWHGKQLLGAGKVMIAFAVVSTLIVFAAIASLPDSHRRWKDIYDQALLVIHAWMLVGFMLSMGLTTKLELREKGICLVYTFISWRRIKSYAWERSKPNTLTIRFAPFLPLSPGFMSIAIPNQHRDEVNRVIQTHISIGSSDNAS